MNTSPQQGLHTLLVVENWPMLSGRITLVCSPKVCLLESWFQRCILCVAGTCECTLHIHFIYWFHGVLYFLSVSRRRNKLLDCLTEENAAGYTNEKHEKTTESKRRGFIFRQKFPYILDEQHWMKWDIDHLVKGLDFECVWELERVKVAVDGHSQLNEIVLGIYMMELCDIGSSSIWKGRCTIYPCTLYENGISLWGMMKVLFNILDIVRDEV